MNEMILLCIATAFCVYQAWRYSQINIELDFSVWALWGVTGAVYGKDFIDCKSPGVHLWFLLLSKIKKDHKVIRLVHYIVTTLIGIVYFLITRNATGAIAFMVLVHSGWMLAMNGNVGDIPAGLILIALSVSNPWIIMVLWGVAVFYEPKLLPSMLAFILIGFNAYWLPSLVGLALVGIACLYLWYYQHPTWDSLWFSNVTLGQRMNKYRKGLYPWLPQWTAQVFLYLAPWFVVAIYARPDFLYWLPCLLYVVFIRIGKVIRIQHMIPVIAWIAGAGIKPEYVYILTLIDWVTAGLYIGNIWNRFYPGMEKRIDDARKIGQYMLNKEGTMWVNASNPEIYIWAKKKPPYRFLELVEINEVTPERRKIMMELITRNPPQYIVQPTFGGAVDYNFAKYKVIGNNDTFIVYQRKGT